MSVIMIQARLGGGVHNLWRDGDSVVLAAVAPGGSGVAINRRSWEAFLAFQHEGPKLLSLHNRATGWRARAKLDDVRRFLVWRKGKDGSEFAVLYPDDLKPEPPVGEDEGSDPTNGSIPF